jgi:cob(I)alamin adenosyltransferase
LSQSEAEAREAWRQGKALIESGKYRLIVFDEITYPINWGWIDAEEVRAAIESRPEVTSLVLTGRDAPEWLMDISDTVTVMENRKHAYESGIAAKKGIDY